MMSVILTFCNLYIQCCPDKSHKSRSEMNRHVLCYGHIHQDQSLYKNTGCPRYGISTRGPKANKHTYAHNHYTIHRTGMETSLPKLPSISPAPPYSYVTKRENIRSMQNLPRLYLISCYKEYQYYWTKQDRELTVQNQQIKYVLVQRICDYVDI